MNNYMVSLYCSLDVERVHTTLATTCWEAVKEAEEKLYKEMPLGTLINNINVMRL